MECRGGLLLWIPRQPGRLLIHLENSIDLLVPSRSAALARASTIAGAKTGPDGEVELVGVWWRFREENEVDPRILREGGWIESKPAGKL